MGQYYMPAIIKKGRITVYDRRVEPEKDYVLAKLLEHGWWKNPTCNAVAKLLYKSKGNLFWCGDYADDQAIHHYIWNCDNEKSLPNPEGFTLDGKFIVNHTIKKFVDCSKYKERSLDKDGWSIHPLPLLTALGNGRGGGDYYDGYPNAEQVGCWAGDLISVEDSKPEGFEEFEVYFIEMNLDELKQYQIKKLEKRIEEMKQTIYEHECSDDFYHTNGGYAQDMMVLNKLKSELLEKQTVNESEGNDEVDC